jgi:hypothetical protein
MTILDLFTQLGGNRALEWNRTLFEVFGPQPETRVGRERNFFIFFARNPLKSPDSEKLMKANESYFAFICFHLFERISR